MGWIGNVCRSSLGKKYLMAITGLALFGFLIAHLAGNILIFSGRDAINAYGVGLREIPYGGLWVLRIGLILAFVIHIFTGVNLSRENAEARPHAYVKKRYVKASLPSRTMIHTGAVVLVFLILHLAHYTWRVIFFTGEGVDELGRPDIYDMVIQGFSNPVVAIFYIACMVVLGFHLHHGLSSMFQTMGLNHSKYNYLFRVIFPSLGWVVAILNICIVLAIWSGIYP
jgi:succinate dehydrogenase / fumarate reductase cytochrome b subunit